MQEANGVSKESTCADNMKIAQAVIKVKEVVKDMWQLNGILLCKVFGQGVGIYCIFLIDI